LKNKNNTREGEAVFNDKIPEMGQHVIYTVEGIKKIGMVIDIDHQSERAKIKYFVRDGDEEWINLIEIVYILEYELRANNCAI